MNIQTLRQLDINGLQEKLVELKQEQSNLVMQHSMRRLNMTHKLRYARRVIARLNTLLSEKTK